MSLAGIGERGGAGAEKALKLVGAECLDRAETGQQQGWHGDQSAAAGDRIHEPRDEGRKGKQKDGPAGQFGHRASFGEKGCGASTTVGLSRQVGIRSVGTIFLLEASFGGFALPSSPGDDTQQALIYARSAIEGPSMPRGLIGRLQRLFEGNASVRKVANDPALMAELLLLLRMALADGEVHEREMEVFQRVCREAFDIDGDGLRHVMEHLDAFGFEITVAQAVAVFRELDKKRRVLLARHMADIAEADAELSRHEVRLLARVVDMLDLEPGDVVRPAE